MQTTQSKYVTCFRPVQMPFHVKIKVNLGRAARTDAGVHAAGNVVSLKMIIDIPGVSDLVARINEELPREIRVWNYVCLSIIRSPHIIYLVFLGTGTKFLQRSPVCCQFQVIPIY